MTDFSSKEASAGLRPRLLAVASGKGGVGKTFLAITLAHAMSRHERVLLVDGDLGLANVDIQLGLMPTHDLSGVFGGTVSFGAAILSVEDGAFDVLPGRSGSGALASLGEEALGHALAMLKRDAAGYQTVLLDIGAGVDRAARRLALAADTLLLVITEDPTSLTDAYAVLKLLLADRVLAGKKRAAVPPADVRVIVNMAGSTASGLRAFETLTRATAGFLNFRPALAGTVRRDDRVKEAIRRQTSLLSRAPQSIAGADILHLATRLTPLASEPLSPNNYHTDP